MDAKKSVSCVQVDCDACGHTNNIPLSRLYDGFEGIFQCTKCKQALDTLHYILDE